MIFSQNHNKNVQYSNKFEICFQDLLTTIKKPKRKENIKQPLIISHILSVLQRDEILGYTEAAKPFSRSPAFVLIYKSIT